MNLKILGESIFAVFCISLSVLVASVCTQTASAASIKHLDVSAKSKLISVRKVSHINVDDGVKNQEFLEFRNRLLKALEEHNLDLLKASLSHGIEMSIGGERGVEAFTRHWQDFAPESLIWSKLEKILRHGAQYDQESDEFHAPAVSFDDSHSELPQAIIWNKNVFLSEKAEPVKVRTGSLKEISGEQVTVLAPPTKNGWLKIRTANGKIGFVKCVDVYGAYEEFAVFRKVDGKWCLSWFGITEL